MQKVLFYSCLNPRFHYSNLSKVLNWSGTSQKTVCSHQNLFFLPNKGLNNPIWVGRHTKKQFKVVQTRFKDITCVPLCHNVNQMTKYEGYPNSDPFRRPFLGLLTLFTCNIKQLEPILAQIVTRHSKNVFLKSHFSSFVIKQHGNSWKLRWVKSTILKSGLLWYHK